MLHFCKLPGHADVARPGWRGFTIKCETWSTSLDLICKMS
jgi:hypothetical protein